MSLNWYETVMMEILELYHKHNLSVESPNGYRNRDARENALVSIVKEMRISGLNIANLKNKIKTIRTMYKKAHSLVFKSIKSGMGTEELFTSKLFWYKITDIFLKGVTNTRDTSSNLDLQHEEAESQIISENAGETKNESEFPPSIASSASSSVTAIKSQAEAIPVENTETANAATPK
ncbi:unnamed protein product [Psylliodes chrysocephalus]|uniref:MADF domain-containing protein n=1 Tax=Psylliodes chrysocephalus TaxID=3402493 RepID=A0A9P0D5L1_9CUCU|nr:unnamed protein product [Psylliodes chrysocephala]